MKPDKAAALRDEPLAMTLTHSLRQEITGDVSPLVLAADVGGTHARIGLLQARAGAQPPLEMLARHVYECAKWPGLGEILEDFIAHIVGHYPGGHVFQKLAIPHAETRAICGERLATARIVTILPRGLCSMWR